MDLLSPKSKENEVSVEWFLKLKEIDSLTHMRNRHLKTKGEQVDRVSKLNDRRQEGVLQTAKLKQELVSVNQEMAEVEAKIKTASEQKQRLTDIGSDENKIKNFTSEIAHLEDKGFEYLNRVEELEKELHETKTFLTGLEKTIEEIKGETSEEIKKIDAELSNIDLRITLLKDELPQDFKTLLEKTLAKNLAQGSFTRVEQGSCYFCRFKISRIEESEIDMQKGLKICPQCSRIFLPYGS